MKREVLLLFIACTLLAACDKQVVYHHFYTFPNAGWTQKDTVQFQVSIPDSQTYYTISLDIRNRNAYPYQNILLKLGYKGPEMHLIPHDTLQFTLANPQGMWKGKGWGDLYQSRFNLGKIKIEKAGDYQFYINHCLPDDVLPGINDIGILLEKE